MKAGMSVVLLVLAAGIAVAANGAEDYVGQPAKHWHEVDTDWMNTFHNPMEGVTMGMDLRLREVYAGNMYNLFTGGDREDHWQRYRLRWSSKIALSEDVDINLRYIWEFRSYCMPKTTESGMDWRQSMFDHFNIQFRNVFDLPMTLTVGRQDIVLGNGWLIAEGTPYDGSRTGYFDAARVTYDLSDTSKLDLIYIQQSDDPDAWLPSWTHDRTSEAINHMTNFQDEQAFIAYYTNTGLKNLSYDAYFVYKNEEVSDWTTDRFLSRGYDAEIYTFGGRLFGALDDNWSYTAELAGQFGDRDGKDLCALGSNNKLTYQFNDESQNKLFVSGEYLSGDDPGTTKDERFDTLWGDYPQINRGGDLQVYMWLPEYGNVAEIGNLYRLGVGHSFKPGKDWTMLSEYNAMWAAENEIANGGKFRGHMLTGLLTYQCCKNFKTQFLIDYFLPQDYYNTNAKDAFFTRVNVEWTF